MGYLTERGTLTARYMSGSHPPQTVVGEIRRTVACWSTLDGNVMSTDVDITETHSLRLWACATEKGPYSALICLQAVHRGSVPTLPVTRMNKLLLLWLSARRE